MNATRSARARKTIHRWLGRIDPAPADVAEPLRATPLLLLAAAILASVLTYLRQRYHPMQDFGHHLAMAAVVADRGRPGSLYTDLYTPFDALGANSLLYTLAGNAGRLVGVGTAMRAAMVGYLAGMPLASLFALRRLGRSPWGALAAVPLAWSLVWTSGFANFVFAGPPFLLTLLAFHQLLERPTAARYVATLVGFVLTFLAHVHVFLWLGVVTALWTVVRLARGPTERTGRLRDALWTTALAATVVMPSLYLLRRWLTRSVPTPHDAPWMLQPPAKEHSVVFRFVEDALQDMTSYLKVFSNNDADLLTLLGLMALAFVCARLGNGHARRPVILEMAFASTLVSYLVLPEHTDEQAVIGSRQLCIAMWVAPVFFEPPRGRARGWVLAALLGLVAFDLAAWNRQLRHYATEVAGLRRVLDAAPPRKRMHYVNHITPDSNYFRTHVFWHVDKWYMADKFGQCGDNPAVGSMNPIRYAKDPKRLGPNHASWVDDAAVWTHFDLVLVHGWEPTSAQLTRAAGRGRLVAQSGAWQLWETRAQPHGS